MTTAFTSDINLLTPNDDYSSRTAPLTSKHCILYIYSTHTGTEYFKHGIYSPFFPLQNAVCFIILTYLVCGLFTFYIQGVLKLKNNSSAKRLINSSLHTFSSALYRLAEGPSIIFFPPNTSNSLLDCFP